jgi:hypothetical protein
MITRRTLLSTMGAAAVGCPVSGWAADAAPPNRAKIYLFNIPAQPLQTALIAYAAVVGTQILYDARIAQDRRSHAVVGLLSADTALRLLISGTDLTVLASGGDAVLVPVSELQGRGPIGTQGGTATLVLDTLHLDIPPGNERRINYAEYGQHVRAKLQRALTSDPRTAGRTYALHLGITIASDGTIGIARAIHGSGSSEVLASLQQVVRTVVIDRAPPAGMPQPIYITIIGI